MTILKERPAGKTRVMDMPKRRLPDITLKQIVAGERAQAILDARAVYSDSIDENLRRELLALRR
ncbi:hypothetical protein ACI3L1_09370 [Deinococcus sp. SM5_A1]|uniref:hypothetical protein n=1 Tax=Deinococcus sp. SM5_A1 TaxID=3379094 RepID=UPI00386001C7